MAGALRLERLEFMAENAGFQIADNSPEQVAYNLMELIRTSERRRIDAVDRAWILDTYSECLTAVRGQRVR